MVALVLVHGYNLQERYLQPFTLPFEPLTGTSFTEYFLANGVFRFRIPMLFAISGYLLAIRPWAGFAELARHRFVKLMVPYFFWGALSLLITLAFEQFGPTLAGVKAAGLEGPQTQLVSHYGWGKVLNSLIFPISFQLWFLRALFVYNLLSPWLKKGLERAPALLLSFFGVCWLLTLGIPFLEAEGLLFFSLGMLLAQRQTELEHPPRWFSPLWFGLAWVAVLSLKTYLAFQFTNYNPPVFFGLSILHKGAQVLGLLFCWFGLSGLAAAAQSKAWFRALCPYGFIIFALHVPTVNYLTDMSLAAVQPYMSAFRLVAWVGLAAGVILACMAIGWVLKNTIPRFYSVVTGGRG